MSFNKHAVQHSDAACQISLIWSETFLRVRLSLPLCPQFPSVSNKMSRGTFKLEKGITAEGVKACFTPQCTTNRHSGSGELVVCLNWLLTTYRAGHSSPATTFTPYTTLWFITHNGDLWEYKHPKKEELVALPEGGSVITFAESWIMDQVAV